MQSRKEASKLIKKKENRKSMASFNCYIVMSMTLLLLVAYGSEARPLVKQNGSSWSVKERVEGEAVSQCWDSLMELRSCAGEVVLFFLNGETYLGPACCRAIDVIEHHCWAADAMFTALGFTLDEGHVLKAYCDSAAPDQQVPPPPPHNASSIPITPINV